MNMVDRIKRTVANRHADVFVRADFMTFGSPAQVGRALTELQSQGVLVKLGVGVYAKAKPSVLSGKPIFFPNETTRLFILSPCPSVI